MTVPELINTLTTISSIGWKAEVMEKMIKELIAKIESEGIYRPLPESIQHALNSGDGTYRP